MHGQFEVIAETRGLRAHDGIFQIVRLPADPSGPDYPLDNSLAILQVRLGYGLGNDSLLDTDRGYRVADMRYSSGELSARLAPIAPPPTPASPDESLPQPQFHVELTEAKEGYNVSDLYLADADMTADSYESESSSEEASEETSQPSIFILAAVCPDVLPSSHDYSSVLDFERWRANLYISIYGRPSVIVRVPGGPPRTKSNFLNKKKKSQSSKRLDSRLPPRPSAKPAPVITTEDAFQGSLLQGFSPLRSPDDPFMDPTELRLRPIQPASPSASPLLRRVNERSSRPVCRSVDNVDMITAGPLYLEDVLSPAVVPVTGAKRFRSLSESDSDLALALSQAHISGPLLSPSNLLESFSCLPRPTKRSK